MTKTERTKPGSKLDWRVTYDSGSKKWTNDRPGDGKGDPDEKEELFDDLTVKRGVDRLEKAVSGYADGKGSKAIENAVETLELHAGKDAAKAVIRAIYKAVKGNGKIEEGVGIAKNHVNRDRKKKAMKDRDNLIDRVAKSVVAAHKGPVEEALDARHSESAWNVLHDIESGLENAAHDYDIAASYNGKPGEAAAAGMRDVIMNVKEQLERLSFKAFAKIQRMEQGFVREFGTPDDYAEAMRREIFPASEVVDMKDVEPVESKPEKTKQTKVAIDRKPVTEQWKSHVLGDMEEILTEGMGAGDVEYSEFLTLIDERSNKFHYFVVFGYRDANDDVVYVGGNAYGRIGMTPRIMMIARGLSLSSVENIVRGKQRRKESKGYE